MHVQCRSIYMVDNGVEPVYYRCLLDSRHTSKHFGAAIDQFGTLIPERKEEVSWNDDQSLNTFGTFSDTSNHPHHPNQMQFPHMETPS